MTEAVEMSTRLFEDTATKTCPDCGFGIIAWTREKGWGKCFLCLMAKKNENNPDKTKWYDEN